MSEVRLPIPFTPRGKAVVAAVTATLWLAGCSSLGPPVGNAPSAPAPAPRDAYLAAFSTQLTGMNEVPSVPTPATGRLDAVLNKQTNQLRWKLTYTALSGPATMGHFHGPAAVGANAAVVVPFTGPLKSPLEGQATLKPEQAADLLAGRWYVNIHTAARPAGEIRGQMILRE